MVTGLGIISFRLHDCRSLKAKRRIIKTIINGLTNKFGISVAEIGDNDVYEFSGIGFAVVGNDKALVNSIIDKVFNFAESMGVAEIIDTQMEMINI